VKRQRVDTLGDQRRENDLARLETAKLTNRIKRDRAAVRDRARDSAAELDETLRDFEALFRMW
jgi:hypothetical protein